MTERTFVCSDGFSLAAQCYRPPSTPTNVTQTHNKKILLLHGWLDNCRSFWKLAPNLLESSYEVVALDLPGHGLSDHRPPAGPTVMLPEAVYYVAEVLDKLEWNHQVTLIGHSMGAAISLAYTAAFPEQVERLVLLEGVGPLTKPDEDVTKHLRRHVESRMKGNVSLYFNNDKKGPRLHASLDAAIETRRKTATLSPGNQYLSQEAATELVTRATRPHGTQVQFLHDYRLTWPSLMYMTHTQVAALQQAVRDCPTCILLAEDGWPFEQERLDGVKERIQPQQFAILPGSHHFHADPASADLVSEHILQFLESSTS
ncbi:Serine hydrolase-like protein DDB_G0286239 [Seminavis robusta]|uniref:Serine hydrolase-like protein DDB_G0286239 n=1 Tax=Seminavis robusta TaxID=568900 RepID=A0A9N8HKY3_9STRA|nr:Serine hydrolase-like protein DDB_G0286239 [Seminavis robusta]|eukprot:Sro786_g202200.1 Serine hydrolase-like protein DDB_G0286239 (315) ;mRNA; f:3716-4660